MESPNVFIMVALMGAFIAAVNCAEPTPSDGGNIVTEIPIRWEWKFMDGDKEPETETDHVLSKLLKCPVGKVVKINEAIYTPNSKTKECLDWVPKLLDTERAARVCDGNKECNAIADISDKSTPRCDGWVYKTTHTCVPEGSITTAQPAILRPGKQRAGFRNPLGN